MFQYLENLRKKPEPERKKAVFLISLYITLGIAIIWGISTSIKVSGTNFDFDTSAIDKKMPSLGETFDSFTDKLGQIFNKSSAEPVATTTESEATTSEQFQEIQIEESTVTN